MNEPRDSWVKANYDEIYGRAFERFLLELARGYAAEEERVHLEMRGKPLNPQIRKIELSGEYPETGFSITTYDRVRDLEQTGWWFLWGSPEFFDEDRKPLCEPERMVSDTLMWARGG